MRSQWTPLTFAVAIMLTIVPASAASSGPDAVAEIQAFNKAFTDATQRMDSAAAVNMWADDGVSLLPGLEPLVGKAEISKAIEDVTAKYPGFRVVKQVNDFHDILVSGGWASEWGTTRQTVQPPNGKPALEIQGKILLVLHKQSDGSWKIEREMWTR